MSTLSLDDLDMETKIRRDNLRMAFRNWLALTPDEFERLIAACRLEWGEHAWWGEVMR